MCPSAQRGAAKAAWEVGGLRSLWTPLPPRWGYPLNIEPIRGPANVRLEAGLLRVHGAIIEGVLVPEDMSNDALLERYRTTETVLEEMAYEPRGMSDFLKQTFARSLERCAEELRRRRLLEDEAVDLSREEWVALRGLVLGNHGQARWPSTEVLLSLEGKGLVFFQASCVYPTTFGFRVVDQRTRDLVELPSL